MIFAFLLAAYFLSCRKVETQIDESHNSAVVERFFNTNTSADPYVRTMTSWVKRQNEKFDFVEKLSSYAGFPIWSKARRGSSASTGNRSTEDDTDVVHIPFARDTQNYVNAILIIKTKGGDTAFQLLYDFEYEVYGYEDVHDTAWNARSVFHLFTALDYQVFGTTHFKVKDDELIHAPVSTSLANGSLDFDSVSVIYHFSPSGSTSRSSVSSTEICTDYEVCIATGPISGGCLQERQGRTSSLINPVCCIASVQLTSCTTFWFPEPSGGGGSGGSGGGSSGGGGGSGWVPPPPPCGPSSRNPTPCAAGWIPLGEPIGNTNPGPPNDTTIAQGLNKIFLKAKTTADSLHTKAQTDNKERVFTIEKNETDTLIRWIKEGTSHSASPTLTFGAIAYCHTHQEDPDSYASGAFKNECIGGSDIYQLFKIHTIDRMPANISFVTTRDYVYATIVVDKPKFYSHVATLCESTHIKIINDQLYNLFIAAMDLCTGCTWQQKTEAGIMSLTSSNNSSVSGIKIFRSPRNSINFTLLTP